MMKTLMTMLMVVLAVGSLAQAQTVEACGSYDVDTFRARACASLNGVAFDFGPHFALFEPVQIADSEPIGEDLTASASGNVIGYLALSLDSLELGTANPRLFGELNIFSRFRIEGAREAEGESASASFSLDVDGEIGFFGRGQVTVDEFGWVYGVRLGGAF